MELPDSGIKKVIIPKSNLPQRSGENSAYAVRFRVISEDKNRSSYWSIKYLIPIANVSKINYRVAVSQANDTITTVWTPDAGTKSEFDIYVKWDNEEWQFVSTVFTTSHATIIKTGAQTFQIAVQVPTFPKQRYAGSTLFESPEENV